MDLGKLGKRLRNEVLRNPKKSAILGIICLVALYFWAPLVRGWLPGGKAKKPPNGAEVAVAAPVSTATTPSHAEAPNSTRAEQAYRWDQLVQQRKSDPFASPRKLESSVRNPFEWSEELRAALAAAEPQPVVDDKPAEKPAVDPTPQELGLVLKGTIVGKRLRAAQINARTFREGESFHGVEGSASRDGPTREVPGVEFTLASVHKEHVVLTRGDKSYTLEFPQRKAPPGEVQVQAKSASEEP